MGRGQSRPGRAGAYAALAVIAVLAAIVAPSPAPAREPADLCLRAAARAAERYGVPEPILLAITAVETRHPGRGGPWPWTLNLGGDGRWFETRDEALAAARRHIGGGRSNIDLGCFQLNHHWHGQAFDGPGDMLDPDRSADHAARFLARLHRETGDWVQAAGYYHSRTPEHFERYRALVLAELDRLGSGVQVAEAPGPRTTPETERRTRTARPLASVGPAQPGGVQLSLLNQAVGMLLGAGRE